MAEAPVTEVSVECAAGHAMTMITSPVDGFTCNTCTRSFGAGSQLFACTPCDQHVCPGCTPHTTPPAGVNCFCPASHPMVLYKTPVVGYKCNACDTVFCEGTNMWACRPCDTHFCSGCSAMPAVCADPPDGDVNCPAGHPMHYYHTPQNGFSCDTCKAIFTLGSALWGCRICNIDFCQVCSSHPATEQPAPEGVTVTRGVKLTCSSGHNMYVYATPQEGFKCDHCKAIQATGNIMWGCTLCNIDICIVCSHVKPEIAIPLAADRDAKCPAGHAMHCFLTPQDSYSCDQCKTSFPGGTTMFGCDLCNIDLCVPCLG